MGGFISWVIREGGYTTGAFLPIYQKLASTHSMVFLLVKGFDEMGISYAKR